MGLKMGSRFWAWLNMPLLYVFIIGLGILAGWSDVPFVLQLGVLLSEVFIRIFKCVSLPVISLSIMVTLASYQAKGPLKRIWQRAMRYTLGTTFIAAFISFVLYVMIAPQAVSVRVVHHAKAILHANSYLSVLRGIIPDSLLAPFLEHQVISVLILSIAIGIAIQHIPDEKNRATVCQFIKGIHSIMMVVTQWIIKIIPIGLFGFITTTVMNFKHGFDFKGIGQYLLVIVLANLVQGFVVLPLWLKYKGIQPFKAMKGMMPALSLAFFSKSSVGTLPVTMEAAEAHLGVKPEVSRFILPFCTSLNMNGCAAFIFTTVVFLMQNNGIDVSLSTMLLWVVIATIAAIGNAGVPMGCFFLSTSLLASMNVPIVLMGAILPFYGLIDMLETALNVWSDSCVAKVVSDAADESEGINLTVTRLGEIN